MSQITVKRSSEYANKLRKIKLVLDDQVIEAIDDGETKTIQVKPGSHKLKATIDWCQSNEIVFNINEGEDKEFSLKGRSPMLALYYITFGKDKYLQLETQN